MESEIEEPTESRVQSNANISRSGKGPEAANILLDLVRDRHRDLTESAAAFERSSAVVDDLISYESALVSEVSDLRAVCERKSRRISELQNDMCILREQNEATSSLVEMKTRILEELARLRLRPLYKDWDSFCVDLGRVVHDAEVQLGMQPPYAQPAKFQILFKYRLVLQPIEE